MRLNSSFNLEQKIQLPYFSLKMIVGLLICIFNFSIISPALAMVPPASRPVLGTNLVRPPESCSVGVSLAPHAQEYYPGTGKNDGDTVYLNLTVARYRGEGKVGVVIEPEPNGKIGTGRIDDSSVPNQFVVETAVPNRLVLRTVNRLSVGQNITIVLAYKLSDDPNLANDYPLKFNTKINTLTDSNVIVEPPCTASIEPAVSIKIKKPIQFDTAAKLRAQPSSLHFNEVTRITGSAINELTARDHIPPNIGFKLTMTLPASLQLINNSASPGAVISSSPASLTWQGTSGELGVKIGETFPTVWYADFKKASADYVQDHLVKFCISIPSTNQWAQNREKDGGLEVGNNCIELTLHDSPVTVTKTWDNGQTNHRRIEPNSEAEFKINLTNNSAQTINGFTLTDQLQRSEDCNDSTKTCPSWDPTVAWLSSDPAGTIVSDSQQDWTNLSIQPGTRNSLTYKVKVKVATEDRLLEIMNQNNAQDRCNAALAKLTIDGVNYLEQSHLCFNFNLESKLKAKKSVSNERIKAGERASYKITVTNEGRFPAFGTEFIDRQDDPNSFTKWESEALLKAKNLKVDAKDRHVLTSIDRFNIPGSGAEKIFEPRFYVLCNSYERKKPGNPGVIGNRGEFKAQNDQTGATSNNAPFSIDDGYYNLGVDVSANINQVIPGDPSEDRVNLEITASNLHGAKRVNVVVPDVSLVATVPSQFRVDMDKINAILPESARPKVDGRTIIWPNIDGIGINSSVKRYVTLIVDPQAVTVNPASQFVVEALSESRAADCGQAYKSFPIPIRGIELTTNKRVYSPITSVANPGETVRFGLNLTNTSTVADLNRPTPEQALVINDPLPSEFEYVGNPDCTLTSSTNATETKCNIQPTFKDRVVSWKVAQLSRGTTISLKFDVKIAGNFKPQGCPSTLYNSSAFLPATVNDPQLPSQIKIFGPAPIYIYPDLCLKGNIYAKGVTGDGEGRGITINSDKLVIDPNTVLSAKGSIACKANQSCIDSAYKFGAYDVDTSVGLSLDTVVARMRINLDRVLKTALALNDVAKSTSGVIDKNSPILKLSSGSADSDYPEGRVLTHFGDLTIQTVSGEPLEFKGKLTLVVCGDLKVTGNGELITNKDNGKSALGLIVLPKSGCIFRPSATDQGGGNLTIEGSVRKLVGVALYAPGSNDQTVGKSDSSGIINFAPAGPDNVRLQPAEGLFIARQFIINRQQVAFRYRQSLNTPEGAAPGFSFTASPNDTNEGR